MLLFDTSWENAQPSPNRQKPSCSISRQGRGPRLERPPPRAPRPPRSPRLLPLPRVFSPLQYADCEFEPRPGLPDIAMAARDDGVPNSTRYRLITGLYCSRRLHTVGSIEMKVRIWLRLSAEQDRWVKCYHDIAQQYKIRLAVFVHRDLLMAIPCCAFRPVQYDGFLRLVDQSCGNNSGRIGRLTTLLSWSRRASHARAGQHPAARNLLDIRPGRLPQGSVIDRVKRST